MNGHDDYIQSTNDELERQEQEEIEMQRIADEEDNGYDHTSLKREIPDMTFWEEQAFENERQDGGDEDEL
jgi:hypothetical protein